MLFNLTLSAVLSYHLPKTSQFKEQCHKDFAQLEYSRKEGSASLYLLRVYIILHVCSLYTYVLLVKRGVKMAKYWPSSFIHFYSSRSIKTQKRTGQYTCKSILIRTSSVNKEFIIWPKNRTLSCGEQRGKS